MVHGWNHACHDTWKAAAEPHTAPSSLSVGVECGSPTPSRPALPGILHRACATVRLQVFPSLKGCHLGLPVFALKETWVPDECSMPRANGRLQAQLVREAPQWGSRFMARVHRLSKQTPSVPSSRLSSGQSGPPQALCGPLREAWSIIQMLRPGSRWQHIIIILSREVATMKTSEEDGVKGGKVLLETCEPIILVNNPWAFSSGSPIHFFLWWSHINSWGNVQVFRILGFYYAPHAHAHISPSSLEQGFRAPIPCPPPWCPFALRSSKGEGTERPHVRLHPETPWLSPVQPRPAKGAENRQVTGGGRLHPPISKSSRWAPGNRGCCIPFT